jgi:hypothetical protein
MSGTTDLEEGNHWKELDDVGYMKIRKIISIFASLLAAVGFGLLFSGEGILWIGWGLQLIVLGLGYHWVSLRFHPDRVSVKMGSDWHN